jgi:hypothetical protein
MSSRVPKNWIPQGYEFKIGKAGPAVYSEPIPSGGTLLKYVSGKGLVVIGKRGEKISTPKKKTAKKKS